MKPKSGLTIELTAAEAAVLHEALGDVPKKYAAPKLLQLYERLDNYLGLYWKAPRKNAKAVSE